MEFDMSCNPDAILGPQCQYLKMMNGLKQLTERPLLAN